MAPRELTKEQQRLLNKIGDVLSIFQAEHALMSFEALKTFLRVAADPEKSMSEYARDTDLPMSTVSRHLLDLGERNRKKEPGLNLVEARRDPNDYRRWTYTLTPKGRGLLLKVAAVMEK